MKITNKYNLPSSIYNALKADDYDYQPNKISVTTLINSPWLAKLKQEHYNEIEEDCTERIWAIVGSSIHYMLDKADDENAITEHRIEQKVNDVTITGKFDRYEVETKTLQDYKITSVWNVIFESRMKEWAAQLNIYRWLMAQHNMDVEKIQVIAILRDWVKSKAGKDNYPEVQIKVIDIPIASLEYTEDYIKERIEKHQNPTPCDKEERWATDEKWAIMKKGRKSAVKLFDSETEAQENLADMGDYIEYRPGIDRRCSEYCNVNKFCEYYQKNYGGKK